MLKMHILIFSKLDVIKLLTHNYLMHNLYAIFTKSFDICKQITDNSGQPHQILNIF